MWTIITLLLLSLNEGLAFRELDKNAEYDFETADVHQDISLDAGSKGRITTSTERYKHGKRSLKWSWEAHSTGQILRWKNLGIPGKSATYGGIVFHVYNPVPKQGKCMYICALIKSSVEPNLKCQSCFYASLGFKGWRTIWVSYKEFRGCPSELPKACQYSKETRDTITMTEFSIQAPRDTKGSIYIDYFSFVKKLKLGSRDFVIPGIKKAPDGSACFTCEEFDKVTEKDLVYHMPQYKKWEHALKWYLRAKNTPNKLKLSGDTLERKFAQVKKIKQRMLQWYADEDTDYFSLKMKQPHSRVSRRFDSLLKGYKDVPSCWKNRGNIICSHRLFNDLSINSSTLVGPALYCRDLLPKPINKERNFRDVFSKALLPIAMDRRIWSKVNERACALATWRKDLPPKTHIAWYAMTALDEEMEEVFKATFKEHSTSSSTVNSECKTAKTAGAYNGFKEAIKAVNKVRLERIILLLKYIRDQGFDEGSGLGSLDHQMLYGHGIVHTVLIMSDAIQNANDPDLTIHDLIRMLKWYLDFGQIDQKEYDFKGATCDQVRFHMLFRLVTILAMPEVTDAQKNEKIEDLKKLVKSIDEAFTLNQGLFGLLSPDYLIFHHSFYYAGAYGPEALHVATLSRFMLSNNGADLSFPTKAEANLIKALKVERDVCPLHSVPPSCNGRYPQYNGKQLARMTSAFAYMAFDPDRYDISKDPKLRGDKSLAEMFARLKGPDADPADSESICPDRYQFCSGRISDIMFMNSLGEAHFMENAHRILKIAEIKAEGTPRGNWAKNYAALAVHRRNKCVITAKGFNRYVYDPERYSGENEYGLYEMNGAVLIANSEDALKSKNVEKGWDWCKIPATTGLQLTFQELRNVGGNRYTNGKKLAGAISLIGLAKNKAEANGGFGMNFAMPKYWYKEKPHPLQDKAFNFKKSVFFFDTTIIFVGSGMSSTVDRSMLTTLFQDSVTVQGPHPSDESVFYCNHGEPDTLKDDFNSDVTLVDVHNNRYYIPGETSKDLVFTRGVLQKSVASEGTYCTAWLDHGLNAKENPAEYEYFVQTNCAASPLPPFDPKKYNVLEKSENAHVVLAKTHADRKQYGYVIFSAGNGLPPEGPILTVDTDCLVMVETASDDLAISVSYPQMNLGVGHIPQSALDVNPNFCQDAIPEDPESANYIKAKGTSLFFCADDKGKDVRITLREKGVAYDIKYVVVGEEDVRDWNGVAKITKDKELNWVLEILGLKNGKVTEVHLSKV